MPTRQPDEIRLHTWVLSTKPSSASSHCHIQRKRCSKEIDQTGSFPTWLLQESLVFFERIDPKQNIRVDLYTLWKDKNF